MIELFVTISGLIIVINIIYIIIPSEKYARYCRTVIGIVTMISIINLFSADYDMSFNIDIKNELIDMNTNVNNVFDSLTTADLETKIRKMLTAKYGEVIKGVHVEYLYNEIKSVTAETTNRERADEIKNDIALFCDIKIERVMVKYL